MKDVLKALGFLVSMGALVLLYPFINRFMTQVIFKSKKRTRRQMLKRYHYYKKKLCDKPEKELLMWVMQTCFLVLDKKRDSHKSEPFLTRSDVDKIVSAADNIDDLINIVIDRGLSPDMTGWLW